MEEGILRPPLEPFSMIPMPVIYGAGITKSMRSFRKGGSDGSISLLDLFVVDGLMLVI